MTRKPLSPAEERFINIRVQDEESRRAGQEPLPPPPYQVGDVRLLFTGVRFAPGVARRLLPPELEPAGNDAGLICAYTVGTGWGVAPYSSLYAAVEVKGVDAPDGSSGYCIVAGWYSGGGYRFMHRYYNLLPEEGGCRLSKEGGLEVAVAGPAGVDAVTMRIRRTPKGPPQAAVVHHYLGNIQRVVRRCLPSRSVAWLSMRNPFRWRYLALRENGCASLDRPNSPMRWTATIPT